jgi:hypothetical protein
MYSNESVLVMMMLCCTGSFLTYSWLVEGRGTTADVVGKVKNIPHYASPIDVATVLFEPVTVASHQLE